MSPEAFRNVLVAFRERARESNGRVKLTNAAPGARWHAGPNFVHGALTLPVARRSQLTRKALGGVQMTMITPQDTVDQFNRCINAADLDGLGALMTDDHVFIDSTGSRVVGKVAAVAAWEQFFATFPDYQNEFLEFSTRVDQVAVLGKSHCSDSRLEGPALWRAKVTDGKVSVWQVLDDTPESRRLLGL